MGSKVAVSVVAGGSGAGALAVVVRVAVAKVAAPMVERSETVVGAKASLPVSQEVVAAKGSMGDLATAAAGMAVAGLAVEVLAVVETEGAAVEV